MGTPDIFGSFKNYHANCRPWQFVQGQHTDRTKEDDDTHHQEPEGQEGMTRASIKIDKTCSETGHTPAHHGNPRDKSEKLHLGLL